jgi:hypothetical protein
MRPSPVASPRRNVNSNTKSTVRRLPTASAIIARLIANAE